jgi:hypothetical protein
VDAQVLAQLLAAAPEYGLLILAAVGYRWLHREHRAERKEWLAELQAAHAAAAEERRQFADKLERLVAAVEALEFRPRGMEVPR